jgi:predicted Zn-ribbon and HTH transcriptional regulator
MTRRSIFAMIGGLFSAALARGEEVQRNEANVMLDECRIAKYELNPQMCQKCGTEFAYFREHPSRSHRPNFCPNCGGRNIGLPESSDGS